MPSWAIAGGAKHSLDALCTRYGVDRSHRVNHGALLDAALLSQVYIELTGGRQIGLDMGSAPVVELLATVGGAPRPHLSRQPREHHADPVEIARHREFVATLTDPLWATNEDWAARIDA
jgi:DNA polymerase-3 subunit epsilon